MSSVILVTEHQDGWGGPGPASSGRVGIQIDGITFWSRVMNTHNGTTDFADAVAKAEEMVERINNPGVKSDDRQN